MFFSALYPAALPSALLLLRRCFRVGIPKPLFPRHCAPHCCSCAVISALVFPNRYFRGTALRVAAPVPFVFALVFPNRCSSGTVPRFVAPVPFVSASTFPRDYARALFRAVCFHGAECRTPFLRNAKTWNTTRSLQGELFGAQSVITLRRSPCTELDRVAFVCPYKTAFLMGMFLPAQRFFNLRAFPPQITETFPTVSHAFVYNEREITALFPAVRSPFLIAALHRHVTLSRTSTVKINLSANAHEQQFALYQIRAL